MIRKQTRQNCIDYELLTVVIFTFDNWFNQHNGLVACWIINCIFLKHCATSRKVAGTIPDGVIGIFHWHNPSDSTMALGLTHSLTEMSTRNVSWGVKAAGAYGWQPYHLHVPIVLKSGSLNFLEPSGPVHARNGMALHLPYVSNTKFYVNLLGISGN
jgi:hypothetical protein